MPPWRVIVLFAIGLMSLGAIAFGLSGRGSESQTGDAGPAPDVERSARAERFAGSIMPPDVRAPDFSLRDQDGEPISMAALRGRPVIVTFLYTTCEETCPAEAQQVKLALDRVGEPVPALAIAVKPEDDTPVNAQRFLHKQGMVGRMDFVLGSRRELEPVWKGFFVQPQLPDSEHQARTVIVDARGRQRVGFPVDHLTPEALAKDVRTLLEESRSRAAAGSAGASS